MAQEAEKGGDRPRVASPQHEAFSITTAATNVANYLDRQEKLLRKKAGPNEQEDFNIARDLMNYIVKECKKVDDIKELKSSLQDIAKSNRTMSQNITRRLDKIENTRSWAQIAAKEAVPPSIVASNTSPNSLSTSPASPPETRRDDKDVLVNVNKESYQARPTTHAEIRALEKQTLARINKALKTAEAKALHDVTAGTAKLLPSGDWRFVTAIAREAELMKQHAREWLPAIGEGAYIAQQTYGVILDGIRIDTVDIESPKKTIEQFKQQNHRILAGRDITKIRWLQKPRSGKNYASLVMDFATKEDANAAIVAAELFWENESRRVRRFVRRCTLNQCFKCHQYGHRSTQCRNPTRCGHCSEGHGTPDCPSAADPSKAKCANCGKNHPAWSGECKERRDQKNKVKERLQAAPRYWSETTPETYISPGPSSIGTERTQPKRAIGTKRVLSDKDTNAATKKTKPAAKNPTPKVTQRPAQGLTATIPVGKENTEMDVDGEEEVSGLSRSSGSGYSLRGTRRPTTRRTAFDIYEDQP